MERKEPGFLVYRFGGMFNSFYFGSFELTSSYSTDKSEYFMLPSDLPDPFCSKLQIA